MSTGKLTQVSDVVAMDAQTTAVNVLDDTEGYGRPELLAEIRSSFALIEPRAPQVAAWFYEHFFAQNPRYRKLFTVEQANAMLPLVRAIVGDLSSLYRDLVGRHERLEHLASKRKGTKSDPYSDELRQMEAELERDRRPQVDRVTQIDRVLLLAEQPHDPWFLHSHATPSPL